MHNLIERYVHAVINHLPQNQKQDVAMELRTMIEDMLGSKKEQDQEAIEKVLTELGDPNLLASQYTNTKQYLLGPKWFEAYKHVLLVVLQFSIPIGAIIMFMARIVAGPSSLIDTALATVGGVFNIAVMAVFWVTAIFILLERFDIDVPELNQKWTPANLPQLPKARQVSYMDGWLEIFTTIFTLGFTGYTLTLPLFNNSVWQPIWTAAVIILALDLLHQLVMLKVGNWTLPLVIGQAILNGALIITAIIFGSAQNLISSSFLETLQTNGVTNAAQLMNWTIYIVALSIVLISLWQIGDAVRLHLKLQSKF